MSTRIEWLDAAHTAVDWEKPLTEIGSDTLGPGRYALTIGNLVIEGKPEDLADVSAAINRAASYLSEHAARPLTHSDFHFDSEDGAYACPRCHEILEPGMYVGLVGLIQAIDAHIASHRPEHEHGE